MGHAQARISDLVELVSAAMMEYNARWHLLVEFALSSLHTITQHSLSCPSIYTYL
jgi:hypothetical protein